MKHYEQNIDSAFADAVGVGADRARYAHWLETLKTAVPRILAKPQREDRGMGYSADAP